MGRGENGSVGEGKLTETAEIFTEVEFFHNWNIRDSANLLKCGALYEDGLVSEELVGEFP